MTHQLFNYCSFFYFFSSRNPLHFTCQYFQALRKLCLDFSLMYSLSTSLNNRKSIGYKVLPICFNFSQRSTTLRWRWEKKILRSTFELFGVSCYVSHVSYGYEDIQSFFDKGACIPTTLFHFVHYYSFLFSYFFCSFAPYLLWCAK